MKLTKRSVEALQTDAGEVFAWDEELRGFGVRVLATGRKTYLVQYRQGGRTRRVKIGTHGNVTADEARKRAKELLGGIASGENPAEVIATERRAPTIGSLCDRFLVEHVAVRCKPSTHKEYKRVVDLFIRPRFGAFKVADVSRADVAQLHHDFRHIPYQANRTLGVLSKMFNLAELWGLRAEGANPCRLVSKYPERKKERYLSREEIRSLGEVLDRCEADSTESKSVVAAIRLLLFTGCRLSEIQKLRWEHVRPNHLALSDSKTGARKVPLSSLAVAALSAVQKVDGNPHVIVGELEGQHLTDLQRPWRRIRKRAGLQDVRIHDLRHTFASLAVSGGMSLPMVGKLLGHTQVQTTARYAHLADDPVREAAEHVGAQLADALRHERPQLRLVVGDKQAEAQPSSGNQMLADAGQRLPASTVKCTPL